jgi:membrane glycosyltransferase
MNIFTKSYHWVVKKGGMFGFLLLIFIALTAIFNLLGLIVQGPMGLTPTIVSLFTTLFVWIGLNQNN